MATLSNADTIQPDDRLVTVKVTLHLTVNVDAYRREYADPTYTIRSVKEDIRHAVYSAIAEPAPLMPDGIVHDVVLD